MRASQNLKQYLQRREQFKARPYRDQAGIWTIGYGHVIRHHERATLVLVDEAAALRLLESDLDPVELYLGAIMPRFARPLEQHQFDGLCTLAFNVGLGAFERSTCLRHVRDGDFEAAAAEFDRWIYITVTGGDGVARKVRSRGLVNRRRMDRAIFERAEYAA